MARAEWVIAAIERLIVESVGITTVALAEADSGVDLSFSQWRALVVIGSVDAGIRVGEIASRIGSAVPTTSRLVRRLEHRGLVIARRDEADRRATRVTLTASGLDLRSAIVARRRALVREAIADGAEPLSDELIEGLGQIGEALRRYE
jgi:MarR family transcriptional regulator for hemolysin